MSNVLTEFDPIIGSSLGTIRKLKVNSGVQATCYFGGDYSPGADHWDPVQYTTKAEILELRERRRTNNHMEDQEKSVV